MPYEAILFKIIRNWRYSSTKYFACSMLFRRQVNVFGFLLSIIKISLFINLKFYIFSKLGIDRVILCTANLYSYITALLIQLNIYDAILFKIVRYAGDKR